MKTLQISLVTFILAVLGISNVTAQESKKSSCIQLLGAGMYNGILEERCNFSGGVKERLKTMYTEGGCRNIVPQSVVDSTANDVVQDTEKRYQAMGKKKFCDGNKANYSALLSTPAPMANGKTLGEWWCKYGDLLLNEGGSVVKFNTDSTMSRQMGIINLRFGADGKVAFTYDDNSNWKGSWTEDKFGDGDKNEYLIKWNGTQFWSIPTKLKEGFPVREGRVFGGTLLCGRSK